MTALVAAGGAPLGVVASLGSVYQEGIVDAGKEPAFLFLVAFLGMFAFIRTSAHMIRAQVPWWPGNVQVGGTHVHHLVWGIILILVFGWIGIAVAPDSPGREIIAIGFGIGTGMALDEFALWLELKDVYWSQDGRKSIDAVIVAAILGGLGVLGFTVLVDLAGEVERAVIAAIGFLGVLNVIVAIVNFAKEKLWIGLLGLLVLPVGVVAALRLGRPGSPYARLLYGDAKLRRARERFGESAQRGGSAAASTEPG